MQCLTDNGDGTFSIANPQPTEYTTCVYVAASPTELGNQIWNLTPSQGLELSGAIALTWAIAFGFRMGIKSLKSNERENEDG